MSQAIGLLQYRVDQANAVIRAVSDHGERLMYSEEYKRIARFDVDSHQQLWLVDAHTGLKVYPRDGEVWPGFTAGESGRFLVFSLVEYIKSGKAIDATWTALGKNALDYDKEAMAAIRMDLAHCKAVQLTEETKP